MPTAELRTVSPNDIIDRAGTDARPLDPAHLAGCLESVGALGLLEPIVVDRELRLLGGAHRRAACLLLAEGDGKRRRQAFLKLFPKAKGLDELAARVEAVDRQGWLARHPDGLVQVRVIDIDSAKDAAAALAVEAAENTTRKQYDAAALQAIVRRLRAAGYVEVKGRPGKGQKALRPALAAVVGLSTRRLAAILNKKKKAKAKVSRRGSGRPGRQTWSAAVGRLRAAVESVRVAAKGRRAAELRGLLAALAKVERGLKAA